MLGYLLSQLLYIGERDFQLRQHNLRVEIERARQAGRALTEQQKHLLRLISDVVISSWHILHELDQTSSFSVSITVPLKV